MLTFTLLHPRASHEMLGMIPSFLSKENKAPAREQLDKAYQHGGGWQPLAGWRYFPALQEIKYPGDKPLLPIAKANLREETILIYPHSWVCIVQSDGSFEVARMD